MIKSEGNRFRFQIEYSKSTPTSGAKTIDVLCLPYTPYGRIGIGTVHHIAFRTPSDKNQKSIRKNIIKIGLNPTPVIDRTYFHSVYFREPGGVLFEIATDPPGFTVDQKVEELGNKLMLPKLLEPIRERLEKVLPKIELSQYDKNNQNKE
jgi:glyoxalase family protein